MPVRATKRGAERTPFASGAAFDVLICGASFAGLAVARELRATGARVLVLDRYEIGERQTSACAAPTEWLRNLGLGGLDPADVRLAARPHAARDARAGRCRGRSRRSTTARCAGCCGSRAATAAFETAKVNGRTGAVVHTDRGDVARRADRRRAGLAPGAGRGRERRSRPTPPLSRGLEVHPAGRGADLELWLDRALHRPRLRLVVPGPRRAADRRRLVRSAAARQGADAAAGRRRRAPTPCASRATGSRTGCGRRSRTACSSSATRPATACR